MFGKFADRLAEEFKYVLVDSRTGHTDMSGICTMLLPQKLVVVFTPNNQSLTGLSELIRRATKYRRGSDDLRPLLVFPLPSRIEASRENLRTYWRDGNASLNIIGYQPLLETIFKEVYGLKECNLDHYFDEVQIQQSPDYAYGEEITVLTEQKRDRFSMATSYRTFLEWLVTSTAPWNGPPSSFSEDDAQREQDRVFKAYLDWVQHLLTDEQLREVEPSDVTRLETRSRTLAVLSQLDKNRKQDLLRFLHAQALIKTKYQDERYRHPVIGLDGADLREATLERIDLSGDALDGVNAEQAELRYADLSYTDLQGTNLVGANLVGANLTYTDLKYAHLTSADLRGADLTEADLTEAGLSAANLIGARVTGQQLAACKSLTGAITSTGQRFGLSIS